MDPRQVDLIGRYTDMYQVGARNMQNFDLLKELGKTKIPVLLKRGMSATVKDLLMSAEYILAEGNMGVVLCERVDVRPQRCVRGDAAPVSSSPTTLRAPHAQAGTLWPGNTVSPTRARPRTPVRPVG